MAEQYQWMDNPTESGVALCDTDVLNDCLMYLKDNLDQVIIETDNFLPKTGGTVTGDLQKEGDNNPVITVKNTTYAYTDTPSGNVSSGGYNVVDKNGVWIAAFGTELYNDGRNLAKMQVKAKDGTSARIQIWADSSNKFHCSFPMCTTNATTTSTASASNIAAITQNYVNGTSWYRVWSDGWIEQGGHTTAETVSLLKSFSNTNYVITTGVNAYLDNTGTVSYKWVTFYVGGIYTKTVSGFKCYTPSGNARSSFPIDWYACGY